MFGVGAIVKHPAFRADSQWDPDGEVNQLSNLVTILTGEAVGACRIIYSHDDLQTCDETMWLYQYRPQTEFLQNKGPDIGVGQAADLVRIWKVVESLRWNSRLQVALRYFFHAWRSAYLDETCVSLEVTLSTLCGPELREVTAERVAEVISSSLTWRPCPPVSIEGLVSSLFSVRGQLVRRGFVDEDLVCEIAPSALDMTAKLLRRMLLDKVAGLN